MRIHVLPIALSLIISCSSEVDDWRVRIIESKASNGWVLVHEQLGGKRLAFIDPKSVTQVGQQMYYSRILWINHPSTGDRVLEEIIDSIDDCQEGRSAVVNSNDLQNQSLANLEWRSTEGDVFQICNILASMAK